MSDFDPTKHLRQLRGKGGTADYLDVKWRLVWLRSEHPDATTTVEHIEISPDIAIFRATVMIPGGGGATDYGSETPRDFGDFIEKAATKALGRALAQLGYGTQFVGEELDEGVRIVDSPVERPQGKPAPNFTRPRETPAAPARTLATVRAELAPLARQQRTNDESLSPAEYARYHELEAEVKALTTALLAIIRDDEADPKDRKKALHEYYGAAQSPFQLTHAATIVKDSGIPEADRTAAYDWHHERISKALAPAPVAG